MPKSKDAARSNPAAKPDERLRYVDLIRRAAELKPHNVLIAKQLELFKKARDEHNK